MSEENDTVLLGFQSEITEIMAPKSLPNVPNTFDRVIKLQSCWPED